MDILVHILTFQNALNYGAVLQCTALYKTISAITNCDIIDYRSAEIEKTYKVFSLRRSAKKNIRGALLAAKINKKRKSFTCFLSENVQLTKTFKNIKELESFPWDTKDIFCAGSDQIWNAELTAQDKAYFLSFAPKEAKKISYAASFGRSPLESERQSLQCRLMNFQSISVRENTSFEQLQAWEIKCIRSIDPVYLLKKCEWEAMSAAVPEEKKPYVLVYSLQKSKTIMERAAAYAKGSNKQLIVITELALQKIPGAIYIETASPQEFIRYFMKADMIFTNSFHGLSLSIILNKQFFYALLVGKNNTNSRLLDLVTLFGLENQNCELVHEFPNQCVIDYAAVNRKIALEQTLAKKYLTDAILNS